MSTIRPRSAAWLASALLALACASPEPSLSQVHKIYWPNGQLRAQGQVIDGLREGRWTWWHVYGSKKQEGRFRHGLREGEWRTWHPNGELHSVIHYRADRPHGAFRSWRSDGSLAEEGGFQDGARHGAWTAWHPANKGAEEVVYERGEPVSRRDLPPVGAGPTATRTEPAP